MQEKEADNPCAPPSLPPLWPGLVGVVTVATVLVEVSSPVIVLLGVETIVELSLAIITPVTKVIMRSPPKNNAQICLVIFYCDFFVLLKYDNPVLDGRLGRRSRAQK